MGEGESCDESCCVAPWWEVSTGPSLDAAGRVIAFSSRHPIDSSDVKHDFDLFVEEMPLVLGKMLPR